MNISRFFLPAVLLCATVALGQNSDQPTEATQGIEVLTRGPVHEAFAETVAFDPEPGIVVPKLPPAIIQETPPEHRWEEKMQIGFQGIGRGMMNEMTLSG
jgi:hypothetical protein